MLSDNHDGESAGGVRLTLSNFSLQTDSLSTAISDCNARWLFMLIRSWSVLTDLWAVSWRNTTPTNQKLDPDL